MYLAEDFPTAYRERFGLDRAVTTNGLTAGELVLRRDTSFTSIALEGRVDCHLAGSQIGREVGVGRRMRR
jgi:hypothetical protein